MLKCVYTAGVANGMLISLLDDLKGGTVYNYGKGGAPK